jgi:putative chitinase
MSFNFVFTEEHLREIIGNNPYIDHWYKAICDICPEYEINTPKRLAAFIAQCAHESSNFRMLRENLNYRAESLMKTWPQRFPTLEEARKYERKPEMIANKVYANRMGNRDEASGDGWLYLGRGLIQLTGKENYQWFAASLNMDVEEMPEYLMTFEGAVQSACFFWENSGLNKEADAGDIKTMTKKINGGFIGLEDRIKHYNHALHVLGE